MRFFGCTPWRRRQKSPASRIATLTDKTILVIGQNAFRFIASMNQQKTLPSSYTSKEEFDHYTHLESGTRYFCYKSDEMRDKILQTQSLLERPIAGVLIAAYTSKEVRTLSELCMANIANEDFPIAVALTKGMKQQDLDPLPIQAQITTKPPTKEQEFIAYMRVIEKAMTQPVAHPSIESTTDSPSNRGRGNK